MTYHCTTLSSGLRVASEAMQAVDTVAIAVSVNVGSRYETEQEWGLSHILEHMAFKGTVSRSARDIAEAFDMIGGQFNAYTSTEHTVYYAKVLKEELATALDVLSDILLHSVFDSQELRREQEVIIQEIAMHADTPDELILDLFDETAFADQPIGRSILGTPERVGGYARADVAGYMDKHYTAPRIVVSAAGNLEHDTFVRRVEDRFLFPVGEAAVAPPPALYKGGENRVAQDLEQTHLMMGFPGLTAKHSDYYALQVMVSILGGGMSSRLFQEVREKRGLAYHVSAQSVSYADAGVVSMYVAASPAHAIVLPEILANELEKLASCVREEEITRAKNQARAELIMARENPSSIAGWIGRHLLVHQRYIPYPEIIARINAVTAGDVMRMAGQVRAGARTLAVLGPGS